MDSHARRLLQPSQSTSFHSSQQMQQQQAVHSMRPSSAAAAAATAAPMASLPSPCPLATGSPSPPRNISQKLHLRRKGSPGDLEALKKRLSGACLKNNESAVSPVQPKQSPLSSTLETATDAPADMAFEKWLAGFAPTQGAIARQCHSSASRQPLINVATLAELELDNIVGNGRLRHDINFDRELHFRPNLDGLKGKEKMIQASQYWTAVQVELEFCLFMLSDAQGESFRGSTRWSNEFRKYLLRLPDMFRTIKSILITLVPEEDQDELHKVFDIPFILHGIEHGSFDLCAMSSMLSGLLKEHCAPMRDEWIDKMALTLRSGSEESNPVKIVEGLQSLFSILEAMKLDVANHQIRYLRPRLLEDSVAFEYNYFQRRISNGQFDLEKAFTWYCPEESDSLVPVEDRLEFFIDGFVSNLIPQQGCPPARFLLPESFKLDSDRIDGLQRSIHHHVCTLVSLSALQSLLNHMDTPASQCEPILKRGQKLIETIIGSTPTAEKWATKLPNIAAELIRVVLAEDSSRAATTECANLAEELEWWLSENTNPASSIYFEKADDLRLTLFDLVPHEVRRHLRQSPNYLCEALLKPRRPSAKGCAELKDPQLKKYFASNETSSALDEAGEEIQDLTKRVTHMLVLHWRVWAPIIEAHDRASAPPTPPMSPQEACEADIAMSESTMLSQHIRRPSQMESEGTEAVNVSDEMMES